MRTKQATISKRIGGRARWSAPAAASARGVCVAEPQQVERLVRDDHAARGVLPDGGPGAWSDAAARCFCRATPSSPREPGFG